MGLKKNSPGCGCCGCCGGDGLPCISVTFGNRTKNIGLGCYSSSEEAEAGSCETTNTDLQVVGLEENGCKLEWIENESLGEERWLYYTQDEGTPVKGGGICNADEWFLPCSNAQFSRLWSPGGTTPAISVDYDSNTIALWVQENLPDSFSSKLFELEYVHSGTLCGQSLSLTIDDFTVVSSSNVGGTIVNMSDGTKAISVDLVIEASSVCA